jgi:hypothetical protein
MPQVEIGTPPKIGTPLAASALALAHPNQVPGSGDSASIPGGGINVIIDSTNSTGGLSLGPGSSLTVATNGVLNIAGPVTLYAALTNQGTVNWQAGEVDIFNNGVNYTGAIWNEAGALWDIQCDQLLRDIYNDTEFHNAGVLQKDTTTGTTTFSIYLNNSGSVHAESGTIQFVGGSDLGGSFQADASGAIYFGGSLTISITPNFQGPGPVQFNGASVLLNNFAGNLTLNGDSVSGTIATNGVLNIAGPVTLYAALTNQGTVNWQAGEVDIFNNGVNYTGAIWNEAGALWDIQCDQLLRDIYNDTEFHNAGVLQKDTTTGTTTFSIYLNNSGSVHAESGTIQFVGGSDLGGSFQADASGAIYFGGSLTISITPNFQGPGPVQFNGASVLLNNFAGNLTLNGDSVSGTIATNGVLNIAGPVTLYAALTNQGTVNWQAGEVDIFNNGVNYTGAIWNEAGALWDIQCDQLLRDIYNDTEFHNAGVLQKDTTTGTTTFSIYLNNSGSVHVESGTIQFVGGSDLGGSFQADASGAIYFGGSLTISITPNFQGPGPVQFNGASVLLNNFAGNLTLNGDSVSGTIATNGVLNIAGPVTLYAALTNQGTVNWQAGEVDVDNNGVNYAGAIWNEAGALWDIQCDQLLRDIYNDTEFHNAGVLQKDTTTGTTTFSIYLNNSGSVHAESGTIQFVGGSDLGGSFQADASGAIYFGGSLTISITPNFQGPGPVQFNGASVLLNNFAGNLTLNGDSVSGTIATNGVLNIAGPVTLYAALTNQGTVNWQAGEVDIFNNGVNYAGAIWNEAGALWDIQCDQLLRDIYNDTEFHNAGVLQKDTTTGTTTFLIYLNNSGILDAKTGTISLNESYTETSSASQVIGIGGTVPGSGYGQIAFSSATFAGSFNVTLLNGFRPNAGDSFSVLSYPSLTGDFTSMNGLDLGNGLKLVPHFGNTGLTLVAAAYQVNAKPLLSLYPTPNDVLVSWPLNFTGWQLQTTTNLATHVWTAITVNGTNNNTVLSRTGSQGFFRLKSN